MATYSGTSLVRGYAKWFGVDRLCAIKELRTLGADVADAEVRSALDSLSQRQRQNRLRREPRIEKRPVLRVGTKNR
jgi:hypothetical protein